MTTYQGCTVGIRPVRLSDEDGLRDFLYRLSDESTYRRFMSYRSEYSHVEMQQLVDVDYKQSMGYVATLQDGPNEEIIGAGRYDLNPNTCLCDLAVVVRDDFQDQHIGTEIVTSLIASARRHGHAGLYAATLTGNAAMIRVLFSQGFQAVEMPQAGTSAYQLCFSAHGQRESD